MIGERYRGERQTNGEERDRGERDGEGSECCLVVLTI